MTASRRQSDGWWARAEGEPRIPHFFFRALAVFVWLSCCRDPFSVCENEPECVTLFAYSRFAGDQLPIRAAALLARFITESWLDDFISDSPPLPIVRFDQSAFAIEPKYDDSSSATKEPEATPFAMAH
jgi:hypothetical protein